MPGLFKNPRLQQNLLELLCPAGDQRKAIKASANVDARADCASQGRAERGRDSCGLGLDCPNRTGFETGKRSSPRSTHNDKLAAAVKWLKSREALRQPGVLERWRAMGERK